MAGGRRISLRDLCCLFCCPPLPSSIASKLAFTPSAPSYRINEETKQIEFIDGLAEWSHGAEELRLVEAFTTRTSRRNKIACLMVRASPQPRFTILFSHGNAVDLGQMAAFFYGLGYRLNCNVFSYDYSGYGCSTGKPSEKNLYADVQAAYEALRSRYDIPPEKIILYGQSIGTVPSVDLASRHANLAALVLHSPFMSGMRVAFPGTQRTWCCDAFPTIEKVPRVSAPTLVIHGTDDEVIDFSHGVSIYERCPTSVEPLWVPGAGHNDVEMYAVYLERLRSFVDTEAARPTPTTGPSFTSTPRTE